MSSILSRDELVEDLNALVIEHFGSVEAFVEMWNKNIDALEALEKEQEELE